MLLSDLVHTVIVLHFGHMSNNYTMSIITSNCSLVEKNYKLAIYSTKFRNYISNKEFCLLEGSNKNIFYLFH